MFKIHVVGDARMVCVEWCGPLEENWRIFFAWWNGADFYPNEKMIFTNDLDTLERFLKFADSQKWENLLPEFSLKNERLQQQRKNLLESMDIIERQYRGGPDARREKLKEAFLECGMQVEWETLVREQPTE